MDPDQALQNALREADPEHRFEAVADAVRADLFGAFRTGIALVKADDPADRRTGAELLGHVADLQRTVGEGVRLSLAEALSWEHDDAALAAELTAAGHTYDAALRPQVVDYADHLDAQVRFAVAWALPSLGLDDASIEVLRALSRDTDSEVRDWATFGLAESDSFDEATSRALLERATDADRDVRAEAIYGLARRRHPDARRLVDEELQRPDVGTLIDRAAELLDSD